MRGDVLSSRYAEALADVAERTDELGRVRDELLQLRSALASDRRFNALVRTPARAPAEKKRLFRGLVEQLDLSGHTGRLLDYLVEKKRTAMLDRIAASFAREADRRLRVASAEVVSASPLTDSQRQRMADKLKTITDKQIRIIESVDEGLIAGFQVRLDGKFFDGSLRARLNRIRERIAHGE